MAENEEIISAPPCGLLIGIYIFYENWSTETFGKESLKRVICYTYKGSVPLRLSHQGLLVESPISKFENITCLKGCNQEGF